MVYRVLLLFSDAKIFLFYVPIVLLFSLTYCYLKNEVIGVIKKKILNDFWVNKKIFFFNFMVPISLLEFINNRYPTNMFLLMLPPFLSGIFVHDSFWIQHHKYYLKASYKKSNNNGYNWIIAGQFSSPYWGRWKIRFLFHLYLPKLLKESSKKLSHLRFFE